MRKIRDVLRYRHSTGVSLEATHGTATLEETAYLLDLTVGSEKPIVVTGAQRDFDEKDADGPRNILYAAMIAADPLAAARGVMVCVGGQIHAARYVVKADNGG